MKIETYEIEPASTEIGQLAEDGEHRQLCEELGLEGQLSLSNNETQTVFPYRKMTSQEQKVFEVHCPQHSQLKSYKGDAIPVRVLQVAAHAIDCNFLHHLEVWHPEDAKLDPVLVGYMTQYGGDLYLLARWGEVWKPFQQLLTEAKQAWAVRRKAKLEKALKEVQALKDAVPQDAELYFSLGARDSVETSIYF